MTISRRNFLKASAGATSLALLQSPAKVLADNQSNSSNLAMLIDITKCISCWWCYAACKNYNGLEETVQPDPAQPPTLSAETWTTLYTVENGDKWISRKQACNHCTDAACVKVCPTGALSYNELGFVQYDREICSGCGYCVEFCPFGVPQLRENKVTGIATANKCTFCKERVENGLPTACADACPTGAITFGHRSDLVKEGLARVETLRKTNPDSTLYGENELGGLHVLYVLDDSPQVYGLPVGPKIPTAASFRDIFKWVGVGAGFAIAGMLGLNYIIARKRMVKEDDDVATESD